MDSLSHPALLLVDGVSSIGGLDFQMDKWKVDVAVTGSQKALSLPTGLAVIAASPKVGVLASASPVYSPERCPVHFQKPLQQRLAERLTRLAHRLTSESQVGISLQLCM